MSKKILFLIDQVPPSRSANGICADKIMNVLANENGVYCIGTNQNTITRKYNYQKIDGKKKPKGKSIFHKLICVIIDSCQSIALLPLFPATSNKLADRYYNAACELIDKENINTVVAVSFPGETLIACKKLKQKYSNQIKVILYPLDVSIEGNRSKNIIFHHLSCYFAEKNMRNQLQYADSIIVLENAKKLYEKTFPEFMGKMRIAGIPMIEPFDINTELKKDKKDSAPMNIMYAGNISSEMYNPIPTLEIIDAEATERNISVNFHLYGHGDKKLLKKLATSFRNISFINHGWVDETVLNDGLNNADVCLNIAKSVTKTIPSKFFKYMCLNKPIIHYYYDDDDPCIAYLEKYAYAVLIKATDTPKNILETIEKMEMKEVDLEKDFSTCTPKYTAKLIEKE